MSIPFAMVVPHAPVLVPGLADHEVSRCRRTLRAIEAAWARLAAHEPDTVVMVSAAGPRDSHAWVVSDTIRGDFSALGRPDRTVARPGDPEAAEAIRAALRASGRTVAPATGAFDPKGLTPATWMERAWSGPAVHVAIPRASGEERAAGAAIHLAARAASRRWALVAAGHLAHHETRPIEAAEHDRRLCDSITRGLIPPSSSPGAFGEDVSPALAVLAGARSGAPMGAEILAYEHPFGVGALTAILHDDASGLPAVLLSVARDSLKWRANLGDQPRLPHLPPPFVDPAGVYVSLYRATDRTLRASAGSPVPRWPTLADEVADAAIRALRDDRHGTIRPEEIDRLLIEITVLDPLRPVEDPDSVDPRVDGIQVSTDQRSAVMLPDLPGITRPSDQVALALRKARISPKEPFTLHRFRVRRIDDST